jgi:outer membrane biosynthesis protein TonB
MGMPKTDAVTLRVDRPELTRLGLALALSLVLHLLFWGTYAIGKQFHWWERLKLPVWVQKLTQPILQPQAKQPVVNREPPLMFVDVSQSSAEIPKDAKYYSDKSSIASNPDRNRDSNIPQIEGKQEHVPKTEDAERNKFPLMPDPPKPKDESPEDVQQKPKLSPGTMTVAKADLKPQPERTRPRTIKEALLQRNQLPGQKMKQSGGAQQRLNTAYDVKATGFGAYDRAFIDAVSQRWYDLLDNLSYDAYRSGYVKLEFNLNYDGTITEMKVLETTVTETLTLMCRKAVGDPAPFDRWPREMRLMMNSDSRRITFTFFYN